MSVTKFRPIVSHYDAAVSYQAYQRDPTAENYHSYSKAVSRERQEELLLSLMSFVWLGLSTVLVFFANPLVNWIWRTFRGKVAGGSKDVSSHGRSSLAGFGARLLTLSRILGAEVIVSITLLRPVSNNYETYRAGEGFRNNPTKTTELAYRKACNSQRWDDIKMSLVPFSVFGPITVVIFFAKGCRPFRKSATVLMIGDSWDDQV